MGSDDLIRYCRAIEDHLTRVNGGHLVRVVGAGFDVVRGWAGSGIPLSVVLRGIDLKADRHRLGHSSRPLRIEFCDADVREIFEGWRRAVGADRSETTEETDGAAKEPPKRPSLSKHLDRVVDRLGRVSGRVDLPPAFLDAMGELLQDLSNLRDAAKGARGPSRDDLEGRLVALDERLMAAARAAAPAGVVETIVKDAAAELAAFRERLPGPAWQHAVDVTVDRLLRDHFGLPTIGVFHR